MKTIDQKDLATVAGGAAKNDEVTTALSSIQSSIKDLSSQQGNKSNDMLLPLAIMMMSRPAPTVVAPAAPAAAPIVNVSTHVRRRWW
jgi:hypothetical protein